MKIENTDGLLLVPTGKRSRRKAPPRPVLVFQKPAGQEAEEPAPAEPTPTEKSEPTFTLEEAFEYDPNDYHPDVVKGQLSIAYLLESISEFGNHEIDSQIAQGLGVALRHYAKLTKRVLHSSE